MIKLTKRTLDSLKPRAKPYIAYDRDLAGFAVRIMPSGFKSFLFEYRPGSGRAFLKKRVAIGPYGPMTPDQARDTAMQLLLNVRSGADPQAEKKAQDSAITVAALAAAFQAQHVTVHRKRNTAEAHRSALDHLCKAHGSLRAVNVTRTHVESLHQSMAATPYAANRMCAVVSSLYTWANRKSLTPTGFSNPARGIIRYHEQSRERFLSTDELGRLGGVLRDLGVDPGATAAIRLLILTGARLREILHAKWEYVDFDRALLNLPDSKTGKKSIFLSAPALAVLAGMPRVEGSPFLFPVIGGDARPRADLKRPWRAITRAAGLSGLRIHDLRHSFASIGAGTAMGLPMIGKLLGHSQPATTARYAHLDSDPMHRAVNTIGVEIETAMRAKR